VFGLLAQAGWIGEPTARALRAAVGFRNVLVLGYTAVDMGVIVDILERHLSDIELSVTELRSKIGAEQA
jgi:uncharacterized protein YutE (UPF0331/DUF86 family)